MSSIAFSLSDVARLMRKRFDVAARDVGVTGPQWRVLANVAREPGINQGQLSDLLEVEPITTCRMVDRLESAGLVERRRDPADRRAWRIFLTDTGLPLVDRLRDVAQQVVAQATVSISQEDQDRLAEVLEQLRMRLIDDDNFPAKDVQNG